MLFSSQLCIQLRFRSRSFVLCALIKVNEIQLLRDRVSQYESLLNQVVLVVFDLFDLVENCIELVSVVQLHLMLSALLLFVVQQVSRVLEAG